MPLMLPGQKWQHTTWMCRLRLADRGWLDTYIHKSPAAFALLFLSFR